ncbi:alpha/beta hydrolase [Lacipirellula limnantheis]|uniref:Esterase n=1 Tax=Lacipirellula limnantheis TaxID=2528024 RepID=A0A517TRH4_9BACT|nr:alpha/beta hydrolase-fold protein [Lacipirellula limnantheis]QDT70982.1 Putative esterase [Lacipirellula limnantheis]
MGVATCGLSSQPRRIFAFWPSAIAIESPLPVLYCTDGQALQHILDTVSPSAEPWTAPPVAIIGVESSGDARGEEYLLGVDKSRYQAHESLFIGDVRQWTESRLSIRTGRQHWGIFGFSNGGAFALATGLRHPELFGFVIAFSMARCPKSPVRVDSQAGRELRFYLAAGNLGAERMFRKHTAKIARELKRQGNECRHVERAGGHSLEWWQRELSTALSWALPSTSPCP